MRASRRDEQFLAFAALGPSATRPADSQSAPHGDCCAVMVTLLGLGYTTSRLASRLRSRSVATFAVVRNSEVNPDRYPTGSVVIHSVPPLPANEGKALRERIVQLAPRRIVYISSTGVYGSQSEVDENTPVLASDEKARARIDEEQWLQGGPWETLIVRSSAIYGPGRGVHVRIREGRMPRGEPGGVSSRIHVDDLAAVLEAGAFSDLTGAWPLADDYPCPSAEIADWYAGIAGIDLNDAWRDPVPVWGRKVDGRKIRELLGVELQYPRYDVGIAACIAEENSKSCTIWSERV